MSVIIAKTTGFCYGVANAIKKTEQLIEKEKDIFCLGDIIHNEDVIKQLEKAGVTFVDSIEEVKDGSKLIIRAHGEPPITYKKCKEKNIKLFDYTCRDVQVIHRLVKEKYNNGYHIIIFGRKDHPEVIGINGLRPGMPISAWGAGACSGGMYIDCKAERETT